MNLSGDSCAHLMIIFCDEAHTTELHVKLYISTSCAKMWRCETIRKGLSLTPYPELKL